MANAGAGRLRQEEARPTDIDTLECYTRARWPADVSEPRSVHNGVDAVQGRPQGVGVGQITGNAYHSRG